MKLYATITSERGKAANKGGNDYIEILIKAESLKGIPTRANVYRVRLDVVDGELSAYLHDFSTGQRVALTERAGILLEEIKEAERSIFRGAERARQEGND